MFFSKKKGLKNIELDLEDDEPEDSAIKELVEGKKYKPILNTKSRIVILSANIILFIFCFALNITLSTIKASEPQEIVFPEGTLSDSIFESQNTNYEKNADLPNTISFKKIPYYVDVPSSKPATIDTGTAFEIDNDFLMYVTEFSSQSSLSNLLIAQLGKAFLINNNESLSTLQPYKKGQGYLNGYSAMYHADVLSISDGEQEKQVYIIGYELQITSNYAVFVSLASTKVNNASLAAMRDIANAVVKTIRYGSDLEEQQKKDEENKVQQDAINNYLKNKDEAITSQQSTKYSNFINDNTNTSTVSAGDGNAEENSASQGIQQDSKENQNTQESSNTQSSTTQQTTTDNETSTEDSSKASESSNETSNEAAVKKILLPISKNYNDLTLNFKYSNTNANLTFSLKDSQENNPISPASVKDGIATFNLGKFTAGEYIVVISGGDPGNCSADLIENAGE